VLKADSIVKEIKSFSLYANPLVKPQGLWMFDKQVQIFSQRDC
jgi:hypothetical protein